MKQRMLLLLLLFSFVLTNCRQTENNTDYWVQFYSSASNKDGYLNQKGDTMIPMGKYIFCYTDTFRTYAIVWSKEAGIVGIDRQENVLYKVWNMDNGPDYVEDGYFRIVQDNKIGYVDAITGQIIIKPQFDCAFPFENGIAKVSNNCTSVPVGEYYRWQSDDWFYINKKGERVEAPHTNAE